MKLSIIIPTYQQIEYLADCIDSVLAQAWYKYDYEIIIVVDGSNDGSLEVAKKYEKENPEIKVISQINKGLASARNCGIMNSIGDYCLMLDSDDLLMEDCVEKIVQKIEETNADIIVGSFKEFGLSNREVILMDNPKLEDFKSGNRVGYCQAVRRSVLLAVGGYSPKMQEGYEDLHLTINLLTRGFKLVTIPDIIWLYRVKSESMYTKITPEIHKKLIGQINKDFPNTNLNF